MTLRRPFNPPAAAWFCRRGMDAGGSGSPRADTAHRGRALRRADEEPALNHQRTSRFRSGRAAPRRSAARPAVHCSTFVHTPLVSRPMARGNSVVVKLSAVANPVDEASERARRRQYRGPGGSSVGSVPIGARVIRLASSSMPKMIVSRFLILGLFLRLVTSSPLR